MGDNFDGLAHRTPPSFVHTLPTYLRHIVRELKGQEVLAGLSESSPRHFLGRSRPRSALRLHR